MELVDDDGHAGEDRGRHVAIRAPHVDRQPLDVLALLVAVQPGRQGAFVPVGEHLQRPALADVCQDAAHLAVDLRLVDAQPGRQLGSVGGVQGGDVVAGQLAHSLVVTTNVVGDGRERVPKALLLDVVHAPDGHAPTLLDARQGLQERLAALPAPVTLHAGQDAGCVAPDGAVAVDRVLGAVAVQPIQHATLLAGGRLNGVLGFKLVLLGIEALCKDGPAGKVKDVSGHSPIFDRRATDRLQLSRPAIPGRLSRLPGKAREGGRRAKLLGSTFSAPHPLKHPPAPDVGAEGHFGSVAADWAVVHGSAPERAADVVVLAPRLDLAQYRIGDLVGGLVVPAVIGRRRGGMANLLQGAHQFIGMHLVHIVQGKCGRVHQHGAVLSGVGIDNVALLGGSARDRAPKRLAGVIDDGLGDEGVAAALHPGMGEPGVRRHVIAGDLHAKHGDQVDLIRVSAASK